MKKLSLPTWLQIIYFICCALLVICMNLYTACYPSLFSTFCVLVGTIMLLLVAINPMGIIGCIWQIVKYVSAVKNRKKTCKYQLVWVILGPILTFLGWSLSITAFVTHTGGV